jgi:hypothetical protein
LVRRPWRSRRKAVRLDVSLLCARRVPFLAHPVVGALHQAGARRV